MPRNTTPRDHLGAPIDRDAIYAPIDGIAADHWTVSTASRVLGNSPMVTDRPELFFNTTGMTTAQIRAVQNTYLDRVMNVA